MTTTKVDTTNERYLYLDIETYSSEPLKDVGVYKYAEALDFQILILSYAIDDGPVIDLDLTELKSIPDEVVKLLKDETVVKVAHNAQFERVCLNAYGIITPIESWICTASLAAASGYPRALGDGAKEMNLQTKKMPEGAELVRLFCTPNKKKNAAPRQVQMREFPDKRLLFIEYCNGDVEVCREMYRFLERYIYAPELFMYHLDQRINDRGVLIDKKLGKEAIKLYEKYFIDVKQRLINLTGLDNPASPAQMSKWLSNATGESVTSVAKEALEKLKKTVNDELVGSVIKLKLELGSTAVKKFYKAVGCRSYDDGKARGMFLFCGAARTGRWSSLLIQLQNLRRNNLKDMAHAIALCKAGDLEDFELSYPDVIGTLGQLIRSVLVASKGNTLAVSDFSSIEARVLAWLVSEVWRLEVFETHGKIYETSASQMFSIPLEDVGKGSEYRQKGKIAELALGYGGGVNALKRMGGEDMGLSDNEMDDIVKRWRKASPKIVQGWKLLENLVIAAIQNKKQFSIFGGKIKANANADCFWIVLPSGRKLYYQNPRLTKGRYGLEISYMGVNQDTKKWERIKTYGGKLIENVVQAIARDIMANTIKECYFKGIPIALHVHDEVVADVKKENAEETLEALEAIMSTPLPWSDGLPLGADGYLTEFYRKD